MRRLEHISLLVGLSVLAAARLAAQPPAVQWQAPERIPPAAEETSAWFPSLTLDSRGRAHVVWSDTAHALKRRPIKGRTQFEQLAYSVRDDSGWSASRLIAMEQGTIYRHALAADAHDTLHLLFRYSPASGLDLYYRRAPAEQGFTEGNWQQPRLVNFRWNSYTGDLAVRGDVIHMVFDDIGSLDKQCFACADMYYRRSTDGGESWSNPVSLRPSVIGSAWPRIDVDSAGVLHVTWDEGWDRNTGRGGPATGIYMLSADGGETWSTPTLVGWPHKTNAQLAAASDGDGGILLVWRSTEGAYPHIYFQWSTDWGETWSEPTDIPGIRARHWSNNYDRYSMAVDGAGRFNLLAVGVANGMKRLGVYHLQWDGTKWSEPAPVYEGDGFPEYPTIAIASDGTVHATWHLRAAEFGEEVPHQAWYARGRLEAVPPPRARPVPVIARPMAPAAAPVALPTPPKPPEHFVRDPERLRILAASLVLGVCATLITDRVRRRWRKTA